MKFEAITSKDIAKALGLSTSTVSRALRRSYEISGYCSQQRFTIAWQFHCIAVTTPVLPFNPHGAYNIALNLSAIGCNSFIPSLKG